MKHPNESELLPLLAAVDVACWALAVKQNTKKGQRCKVDVKSSLTDLQEAWHLYQIKMSDKVAVLSESKP